MRTMKQASVLFTVQGDGESAAIALDHPRPPTYRAGDEMAVVVTRQERHFEPSMCRVLGAKKKPKGRKR